VRRDDAHQFVGVHQLWVADGELDAVVSPTRDFGDVSFKITLESDCLKLSSVRGKN